MAVGVTDYGVNLVSPGELNDGWITREDAALKAKLSGMRVTVAVDDRGKDVDGGQDSDHDDGPLLPASKFRTVPVFFRLPENEVRRKTFPYVTIDFLGAVRDGEREHRGFTNYGDTANAYTPPGTPIGGGRTELPVPFQMQYQVTQWARWNRHDRQIMAQLLASRLEPRFGFLEMVATADAPDDFSVRRMDLISGPTPGDTRDGEGKRVFRKMYSVSVSSELFQSDMAALAAVNRLDLSVIELA